ncbi:hypothetical protein CC2G_000537 [Coprinopsis cinerea AmutBmut pab1-1]|nr:hypothetical protein CC2G_000537 [Coprinopsis cinerea AmutBmut pab1-1]
MPTAGPSKKPEKASSSRKSSQKEDAPAPRRSELDRAAAGRFIKSAINGITFNKPTPEESNPASTVRVPVKITSKMLERQRYEEEVRKEDEEYDSDEDVLKIFGGDEDEDGSESESEDEDEETLQVFGDDDDEPSPKKRPRSEESSSSSDDQGKSSTSPTTDPPPASKNKKQRTSPVGNS